MIQGDQKYYSRGHWNTEGDPETAISLYLKDESGEYQVMRNKIIYERVLPCELRGLNVLDYGCGIGFHSVLLAKKGCNVIGVDLSETAIDTAKYLADRDGVAERCHFLAIQEFYRKSRISGRTGFDMLFLKDIIEHIPKVDEVIENLVEMCNEKAYALVTTPGSWSISHIFGVLYNRYYLKDTSFVGGGDPTHVRILSPMGLSKFMRRHGFVPINWHAIGLIPKDIIYKLSAFKVKKDIRGVRKLDCNIGGYFPFSRLGSGMLTLWQLRQRRKPALGEN